MYTQQDADSINDLKHDHQVALEVNVKTLAGGYLMTVTQAFINAQGNIVATCTDNRVCINGHEVGWQVDQLFSRHVYFPPAPDQGLPVYEAPEAPDQGLPPYVDHAPPTDQPEVDNTLPVPPTSPPDNTIPESTPEHPVAPPPAPDQAPPIMPEQYRYAPSPKRRDR